jgi:acyl dehydratase
MAIGQSTVVTHRVIANLFYRGFMFHRAPCIGDTLYSTTEIVGLRQNRAPGPRRNRTRRVANAHEGPGRPFRVGFRSLCDAPVARPQRRYWI